MIRNWINKRRAILACAAAALAASLAQPAMAVTTIWDGGGANTNWSTIANWVGDVLPPTTNDVQFANAFTSGATIQTNGNRTANGLIIHTLTPFTIAGGASDVLTLTSGVITRDDLLGTESNQLISTGIALGANANWSIWGSGTLTVNGVISGSGKSLSKFGWGQLVLNGNNTFSGGMLVDESRVQISGNGGGTGAITVLAGAGLELNGGTVTNVMTIGGDGEVGWLGALRGISSTTLTGPITLSANSTLDSESGTLTIAGAITDGANTFSLTKTGAAEVRLLAANTYKGTTTVNDGTLTIGNTNALGTGAVTVTDGGSLRLLSGISDNLPLTLNGTSTAAGSLVGDSGTTSWQGPITLASTSDIGVNAGTLTISGAIGEGAASSSLTKVGPGTLVLSHANTYTGITTVGAGTLVVNTPPAMQNSSGVNVLSGAEMDIGGGGFTSVPLTLAGSGVGGNGALRGLSGAVGWNGPINASSNITIGSIGTLNLTGQISVSGEITKVGTGGLTLSNAGNSFNDLNVNAGTLNIFAEAGIPASTTINVADGASVLVSGGGTVNRSIRLAGDSVFGNLGLITGSFTWAGPVKLAANSTIFAGGNLTISGNIDGAGMTLTKEGTGRLILGGTNSFANANITAGTLTLASSPAGPNAGVTVASASSLELSGAGVINNVALHISGNGPAASEGALRGVNGNNTWSGAVTLDADSSVFVDSGAQLTLSGSIGSLSSSILTKTGPGTLVLSGFSLNSTGGTLINEGTVSIASDDRLGGNGAPVTINGGKLLFSSNATSARDYNLTNGRLQTNAGVSVNLSGHVRGGFLMGPGTFITNGGAIFSGVTSFAGSNISIAGPTLLDAYTNGAAMNVSAALSWDGGTNSSSGAITIQSNTLTATAFSNDGLITINNAATLLNSGNTLTSGGGSRITINSGGTLNVSSFGLNLNGALLVNNGTVTGTTNVNFGSLAKGAGVYGAVNVTDGGRFSPGNSPGSVTTGSTTWNSGGSYLVEIADAIAGAGSGWDEWNIDGILNLNATNSTNGKFTISLSTLDGLAVNFDPHLNYTWPILHASDGIAGFDLLEISLDTSQFKNSLAGGHFSLVNSGNELAVHFSAVPEPTFSLIVTATVLISALRRRRSNLPVRRPIC